jgi:tetratricopeptide (TPR) repeat protein
MPPSPDVLLPTESAVLPYQDTLLRTPPGPGGTVLPEGVVLAGRFQLMRFIARGGMGTVYEAEDRMLRTRVAVKLLTEAVPEAAERIRREVLLARAVAHPNVCRVYELFSHPTDQGELLFLVMELLDGETLSGAIARRGKFRHQEAEPLVRQMAAALSSAHAHGVLHRDFKSSNVLLVPQCDGRTRVVVTDFGVARAVHEGREVLTGTGSYVGTPAYMAPEQAFGGPLTPAADVYALGVVVYEMLTGELPFHDTPIGPGAARARSVVPDPSTRTPDLPGRWRTALSRAMAPHPDDRCPTPAAFLHLLAGGRLRTRGDRRRMRRLLGLSGGFLLALALGGVSAAALKRALPLRQAEAVWTTPSSWTPRGADAAEAWRAGLGRLDASDNLGAATELRRTTALAPDFVLARAELARALGQSGLTAEARDTARFAFEAAGNLPEHQRMAVEAEYRAQSGEPERAAALWGTLFDLFPSDVRLGSRLASVQGGEARLRTLRRLQGLVTTPLQATLVDWVAYAIAMDDNALGAADAALKRIAERGRVLQLPSMRAAAFFEQATVALEREDTDAADRLYAEAMRAAGDSEWGWKSAKDRAITLRFDRPQTEVAAWLQKTVEAARRSGDSRMLADVLWDMAPLQLGQGHLDEADAAAQEAEELDRHKPPEARSRGALSQMFAWREQSRLLAARGALAEAAQRVKLAVEEDQRVENRGWRVLPFQAEVLRARGFPERADDALAHAINEKGLPSFIQGRVLVMRANAQLDMGRLHQAERQLRAAAPMHRTRYDEAWTALVTARLRRLQRRGAEALMQARHALEVSEANGFFEPAVLSAIELGRMEAAAGRGGEARLGQARTRAAGAGHVPLQLEAELALGQVLAERRTHEAARAALSSVSRAARARGFLRVATEAQKTLRLLETGRLVASGD